jgi:preprotein translocase subunit SecG
MLFFIYLFTAVLVLDCLVLILLVLMQLPKKEAGAGLAFGGAATDALFGAGSGNFLTKATKWAAAILFVLALTVSVLQSSHARRPGSDFQRLLREQQAKQPPLQPIAPPGAPTMAPASNAPMPEAPAMPAASTASNAVPTGAPPK